jgi:hypothetical protein
VLVPSSATGVRPPRADRFGSSIRASRAPLRARRLTWPSTRVRQRTWPAAPCEASPVHPSPRSRRSRPPRSVPARPRRHRHHFAAFFALPGSGCRLGSRRAAPSSSASKPAPTTCERAGSGRRQRSGGHPGRLGRSRARHPGALGADRRCSADRLAPRLFISSSSCWWRGVRRGLRRQVSGARLAAMAGPVPVRYGPHQRGSSTTARDGRPRHERPRDSLRPPKLTPARRGRRPPHEILDSKPAGPEAAGEDVPHRGPGRARRSSDPDRIATRAWARPSSKLARRAIRGPPRPGPTRSGSHPGLRQSRGRWAVRRRAVYQVTLRGNRGWSAQRDAPATVPDSSPLDAGIRGGPASP